MKRVLVLVLLTISIANLFAQAPTAAVGPALARLELAGLKAAVTVSRDARSIPYISAQSEADLFFAQGYITASDRLFQMDMMRRLARGRTAEIYGRVTLEEDKRWRRFGFAAIVEESYKRLKPDIKAALDNYARGVNAFIADSHLENYTQNEFKILGYKPEPWLATDSLIIGKILADALSSTWRQDLIRASALALPKEKYERLYNRVTPQDVVLFGKDTKQTTLAKSEYNRQKRQVARAYGESAIVTIADTSAALLDKSAPDDDARTASLSRVGLYAEDLAASNNWVISGKRALDKKPILANDPHLQPTAPGIWYLSHLSAPQIRVSGVTFPGVPGVVLGHNDHIAWGATNVGPDVQDLYVEEFDPQDPQMYKTPKGWEKTVVRSEVIKMRRLQQFDPESEKLDVVETRNGVIVTEDKGKKLALKWTARMPENVDIEAFYYLNKAKDWKQFSTALDSYGGAMQNFIYADTQGNIGWYAAGKVPIRKTGDGAVPYNGATDEGAWAGYIPVKELPRLYNPPGGLIVTANQRIVGSDYKYQQLSRDAASPYRARRLYDLLNANPAATMDSVRDAQHDIFSIPLTELAREIVNTEAASPETLEAIRGWDGKMEAKMLAPALVNEIRNTLANKLTDANLTDDKGTKLGLPSGLLRERALGWILREKPVEWLPNEFKSYKELLADCDRLARANLAKTFGANTKFWTWERVFTAKFAHPLERVPLIGSAFSTTTSGVNGSGQTPNVGPYVSMRHIASPGNWDATRHVIPLGQSGRRSSPHWSDQFESWRTGKPAIFPFSKEAVNKAAVSVLELLPEGK
jgi:penicillin amidase